MPRKPSNNKTLTDRLQRSKVRDETKYKEVEAPKGGGSKIPADVNGIAKITKISFPTIKKGDFAGNQMLYIGATVVEPTEAVNERVTLKDGSNQVVRIEGSLLDIRGITLADTKNWQGEPISFEENFAEAENRLKLIGIPTEDIDDADFEDTITAYPDTTDLYIRFRTWGMEQDTQDGGKQWRVYTVIEGPAEDFVPEEIDDMSDETEEEDDAPAEKPAKKSPPKAPSKTTKAASKPAKTSKPAAKAKEEEPEAEDEEDPIDLGARADNGDTEAEEALITLATAAGIDYEAAESWSDVGTELAEKSSDETEEEDSEEYEDAEGDDDYTPEVDDIVMFKFKGTRKAVEAEVKTVNAKLRTLTLEAVDSDKKQSKVSWDAVEEA